jgi:hypothetical protein
MDRPPSNVGSIHTPGRFTTFSAVESKMNLNAVINANANRNFDSNYLAKDIIGPDLVQRYSNQSVTSLHKQYGGLGQYGILNEMYATFQNNYGKNTISKADLSTNIDGLIQSIQHVNFKAGCTAKEVTYLKHFALNYGLSDDERACFKNFGNSQAYSLNNSPTFKHFKAVDKSALLARLRQIKETL